MHVRAERGAQRAYARRLTSEARSHEKEEKDLRGVSLGNRHDLDVTRVAGTFFHETSSLRNRYVKRC